MNWLERFGHPRVQLRFWGTWTAVWLVLMPVTLFTSLRVSVEYIVFMSLFANAASCGTAWVAALSYKRARAVDEKVDTAAHFEKIETVIDHVRLVAEQIATVDHVHGSQLAEVLDLLHNPPTAGDSVAPAPAVIEPGASNYTAANDPA